MFFLEMLSEMISQEKNPINRMYLNEIKIKCQKLDKIIQNIFEPVENISKSLNLLIKNIHNKKFVYNQTNHKGFKENSSIYSGKYLADLATALIIRNEIINQKGIRWDYQSFTIKNNFIPKSLEMMGKNPGFTQTRSPEILQLTQSIDYQFRISGKRNFQKHEIIIPLIQFYTFRCLSANDFILTSHFSKLAKRIFKNAKSIILVETLEDGFLPVLEKSGIDRIFVMLKFDENQNNHFIPLELINTLNETLNTMIIQENDVDDNQIIFAGLE